MIHHIRSRLTDRAVLRPSRHELNAGNQTRHELVPQTETTRYGRLEYFIQKHNGSSDEPPVLVLKFPGTGGRAERSTQFPLGLFPQLNGQTWTLNPPGYGGSLGRPSLSTIVDAASQWVQHALLSITTAPTPTRVLLCGNSLGSAVALGVAARLSQSSTQQQNPISLLLRNVPPLSLVVPHVASQYPLGRFFASLATTIPTEMNALLTAPQVNMPAVFLQSELDTLVTPAMQNRVFEAFSGDKRLLVLAGIEHHEPLDEAHLLAIRDEVQWLIQR